MWDRIALDPLTFAALAAIAFFAGLVRGFTGFGLSAFMLSLAVLVLPPVELVPAMFVIELAASLLLIRAGWASADWETALLLVAGSWCGIFAGLAILTHLDAHLARRGALSLLLLLALMQLRPPRIAFLETRAGTVAAGLGAGLASGLAGLGGMVIALYMLARRMPPERMRATLVACLLTTAAGAALSHLWWQTLNPLSAARGLALVPPALAGVLLGQRLFVPSLRKWYRPACLTLLIGVGLASLLRSLA